MIENIARLVAALGLSAAATAIPAQAAAADVHDCSEGKYCFYSEPDYQGIKKEVALSPHQCYKANVSWPDGTSSRPAGIVNNRSELSQLEAFDRDSCQGQPYGLLRYKQSVPKISDRAKSFRVAPRCDIGSICIYENKDFTGKRWQVTPGRTNRCVDPGGEAWGYGFYNATNYTATFYRSIFCTILPTGGIPAGDYGAFNDQVHLVKID
ncbi:peptidase inhibitor family I36 protein [Streptomyces sp. NPDC001020]